MSGPLFVDFAFPTADAGTVDRTLPARLSDIHNVRDFGAVGDGVTDDWDAIMACYNWQTYSITTSQSNLVASFTGAVSSAAFTGTISGNNLTTSGVTGTIAIGQTLGGAGVTSCKITSGSGSSWVVDGSPQTVGPVMIFSDCILTASSVTGTITINDYLLNNGGTDASPSTIALGTQIISNKGGGVYGVTQFFSGSTGLPILQNFTSQAMMTVSSTLNLSTPITTTNGQGVYDADNATVAGDGITKNTGMSFAVSSSTITLFSVGGLVNSGDSLHFQYSSRGEMYFPPGNYYVSKPIDFTAGAPTVNWRGEMGATTLSGNFDDYVFKQDTAFPEGGAAASQGLIEKFTVVNTHVTGGAVRLGGTAIGTVRDCVLTANKGISDYSPEDKIDSAYFGSFEITMENITVNPGENYSGSFGIARQSDGPVTNCNIFGCEQGFMTAGGEGAQVLLGCIFEKCGTGIVLNRAPDGGSFASSGAVIAGCLLKNNSIGIDIAASTALATIIGTRIEGINGQAPGGTDPQYGLITGAMGGFGGALALSMIAGITVIGEFAVSGIYMAGGDVFRYGPELIAIADRSTCPHPFDLDTFNGNHYLPTQIACNARHIFTVATIPTSGDNAGQEINVSDGTDGLAWGDTLIGTGTHTTHYAAQWNGSNWTVLGK